MILTDYYRFEKQQGQKSKLRVDEVISTHSYNPFEGMRNKAGELFVYIGDNTHTRAGKERKADMAITHGNHISSIYNPDIELPFWYGDVNHTADALLFVHKNVEFVNGSIQPGAIIEVFVARGQRNNRGPLYNLLCDGGLNEEIDQLRQRASSGENAK